MYIIDIRKRALSTYRKGNRYPSNICIYAVSRKNSRLQPSLLYARLFELVQKIKAGDEYPANYDGAYDK